MRSTYLAAAAFVVGTLAACGSTKKDPNEPEMRCHSESNTGSNIGRTVCTPVKKPKDSSGGRNPQAPRPTIPPPDSSR